MRRLCFKRYQFADGSYSLWWFGLERSVNGRWTHGSFKCYGMSRWKYVAMVKGLWAIMSGGGL